MTCDSHSPADPRPKQSVSPEAQAARRRRIAKGQAQEAEARARFQPRGLQSMLAFPLLAVLDEAGGKARPRDIYEQIADRLSMPIEARQETRTSANGRAYNVLQQQIRWTRQTAKAQGLVVDAGRGLWQLADPAYAKLGRVRRGTAILAWSTDLGVGFWAHAEEMASEISPGSVQLVFTSPVYPISSGREYGRMSPAIWLDWMTRLTRAWTDLLADDGIIALNVADTHIPGVPGMSSYLYRYMLYCLDELGLYEQQQDYWFNPTKLANIQWAGKEGTVPRGSVEHVKFLSKHPFPKRSITPILVPRKTDGRRAAKDASRAREKRPSGYDMNAAAFYNSDLAIPHNVIVASGAPGNDQYARRCRSAGLPVHPARFPRALPERVILQCTDEGDVVYDPMGGSGTTAAMAIDLKRRAIVSEPMLAYVQGQAMRLDQHAGWRWWLPDHIDVRQARRA